MAMKNKKILQILIDRTEEELKKAKESPLLLKLKGKRENMRLNQLNKKP